MANDMAILNSANLPAYLQKNDASELLAKFNGSAMGGISGGSFPRISYRGARWRVVVNGEETVLDSTTIEVAIVAANPAISKQYYGKKYEPGEDVAPDCFSNDGIAPDPSATNKQSAACASCPMNAWGSRVTDNGKEAKACADLKHLAVMASNDLNGLVYALRVPAASLKNLRSYISELTKRGVPVTAVKTTLGFEPDAAFPQLTFKVSGFFDEEQFAAIMKAADDPDTNDLIGLTPASNQKPAAATPAPAKAEPAPEPVPSAEMKQEAAQKPTEAPAAAAFGATAKAEPAPEPAKPAVTPEPTPETDVGTDDISALDSELESILAGIE